MNIQTRRKRSVVFPCLRCRQQRLWLCVGLIILVMSLLGFIMASPAVLAAPDQSLEAPVLPDNCDELAQPGQAPPEACVYGYVYLDGSPAAGVEVTIKGSAVDLSLTTGAGPDSVEPYYAAALSEPPLSAAAGALLSVEGSQDGEQNETYFTAVGGAQQVDVTLSTTCGPTFIPGGVIDSDTTWSQACSPYVVSGNVIVQTGVTLTVEPGTVVQFDAGRALQIDGGLLADGTAEAMAVFTAKSVQSPGSWGYILIGNGGTATLNYNLIEYAGGADVSNNGSLRIDASSPSITNTIVRYGADDGIAVYNDGSTTVQSSSVSENAGTGIYVDSGVGSNMWFNTIEDNGKGGIYVLGGGEYWILNNQIVNNSDGPGVRIRGSASIGVVGNNVITGNVNLGAPGGGIFVNSAEVTVSDNVIMGNIAGSGGGILMRSIGGSREIYIDGNIIVANEATGDGGGIHFDNGALSFIDYNVIAENTAARDGGGLYLAKIGATNSVARNAILRNESADNGSGIWVSTSEADFFHNTIIDNVAGEGLGGIYIRNHPVGFSENNIFDNSPYDVFNGNTQDKPDVIADNNWWFAFTDETIRSHIWDWFDDPSLGFVDFDPYRTDFVLEAPITPPDGLAATVLATADSSTVTVTWQANVEDDLAGYKLYYDIDAVYPYSGTGALEGDSAIDVGDVLSATLTDLAPGTYHLTVTAYDSMVDGDEDQPEGHESWFAEPVTILVPEAPQADFSAEPVEGPAPLEVEFSDLSSGTVDAWTWAFGDGGISDVQNPVYSYDDPGVYTVTLQASGPVGSDTLTRTNYITVYQPPTAAFSASPTSGVAPLTVDFTNESMGDYDTCAWSFGDGSNSSDCSDRQHTYTAAGIYTVSLTVTGPGGSDTSTQSNYVTVSEPATPPTAAFSASPTSGVTPLTVDFTNESTGDYDTCAWAFGDGSNSSDCSDRQHTYTAAGVYTVSLTVSGTGGTDTLTRAAYIDVSEPGGPLTAAFSADVLSGTAPFAVTFTNQSTGDYESCRWDFGDGATSTICAPPAHTYYTADAFHVSLIIQGPDGRDSLVRQAYINASAPDQVWFSNGPDGGSVHDLVMAPSDSDVLYAATDRGVYKSTDGGGHWQASNHPALVVRALAVAPGNPAVVFSGTDDGVYKSVDGGEIWLHHGLDGARVNALAIRHDNGQVIFAAAGKPRVINETMIGVLRSSDGGASWVQVYSNEDDDAVMDLVVDSDDASIIYAAITGQDEGLAKSQDGGDSWTKHEIGQFCSDDDTYALAMTPAGAASRALYAFRVACEEDVYKSLDRGESWTATNTPEWWMPDYPAALAVDPVDPQVVYVGVDDSFGQLLRSSNGGSSWTAVQNGMPEGNPTSIVVDPQDRGVFVAQEEGDIYRSGDLGNSWYLASQGLRNVTVDDLAIHPGDADVILAAINGQGHAIAATADGGDSWTEHATPPADEDNGDTPAEIGALAYDPEDGSTLYAVDAWEHYDLFLYKSTDGGGTWQEHQIVEVINGSWEGMGASAIWVHPQNPDVVLVAVAGWDGAGLFRSFNGGSAWVEKLNIWTNDVIGDPNAPNTLYAATARCGYVYRSTDSGFTWDKITPGECWVWEVNDLAVTGDGDVLAATSAGLRRWDGAVWHLIGSLPAVELTAVTLDRSADPETIYVGTNGDGVFASYDGGANWTDLSAGLGDRSISELAIAGAFNRRLYAGTADGGVWQWNLPGPTLDEHLWLPLINR